MTAPHPHHTITRDSFTLWADRVPAMHGSVSIFTLWEKVGPEHKRRLGGVRAWEIRRFFKTANGASNERRIDH